MVEQCVQCEVVLLGFIPGCDADAAALAACFAWPGDELLGAAGAAAGSELRDVAVFDEYRSPELGAGRKSLAFAVAFQSPLRTLTDEDAAGLRQRIVAALGERFGAELRA